MGFAKALAGVLGRRIVIVEGLSQAGINGVVNKSMPDTIFLDITALNWHATAGRELRTHGGAYPPQVLSVAAEVGSGVQREKRMGRVGHAGGWGCA